MTTVASTSQSPMHGTAQEPAAPPVERPAPSLLTVCDVQKSFGATTALRGCSFDLRAGEVHALVGENGSGKSTLVKVLSGVHRPGAGTISVAGRDRGRVTSPRGAQQAGIVTVFQEVLVVGPQTVFQNVWLGSDGLTRRRLAADEKQQRATRALTELLGRAPDLDTPIESLSLSTRQACCIARALVRDPGILILDEATSALDIATRDRLFDVVRRLCAGGAGVIFISHRMSEIDELADRVTVLRSGESVATLARAQATTDVLVRHMTGDDQLTAGGSPAAPYERLRGEILLRADRIQVTDAAEPFDFSLHAGELVGLAGLEGAGQDAFLRSLVGACPAGGRVTRGEVAIDTPERAMAAGVVYVPRDRQEEALFPTLSIRENFALPTFVRDRQRGLLKLRDSERRLRHYAKELGIRMSSPAQMIAELSGGNAQKVVLARWLAAEPQVLLLNDPTRGVDLNAKRDIYRLLEKLAADGIGVVMLSSEIDEHIELMDRVLVFHEGGLSAELTRDQLNRGSMVAAFFGEHACRHD